MPVDWVDFIVDETYSLSERKIVPEYWMSVPPLSESRVNVEAFQVCWNFIEYDRMKQEVGDGIMWGSIRSSCKDRKEHYLVWNK